VKGKKTEARGVLHLRREAVVLRHFCFFFMLGRRRRCLLWLLIPLVTWTLLLHRRWIGRGDEDLLFPTGLSRRCREALIHLRKAGRSGRLTAPHENWLEALAARRATREACEAERASGVLHHHDGTRLRVAEAPGTVAAIRAWESRLKQLSAILREDDELLKAVEEEDRDAALSVEKIQNQQNRFVAATRREALARVRLADALRGDDEAILARTQDDRGWPDVPTRNSRLAAQRRRFSKILDGFVLRQRAALLEPETSRWMICNISNNRATTASVIQQIVSCVLFALVSERSMLIGGLPSVHGGEHEFLQRWTELLDTEAELLFRKVTLGEHRVEAISTTDFAFRCQDVDHSSRVVSLTAPGGWDFFGKQVVDNVHADLRTW
jgi:hypothetical protein